MAGFVDDEERHASESCGFSMKAAWAWPWGRRASDLVPVLAANALLDEHRVGGDVDLISCWRGDGSSVVDLYRRCGVGDPDRAFTVSRPVDPRAAKSGRWALSAVLEEADAHGVSTRKVDDLVVASGSASGISKDPRVVIKEAPGPASGVCLLPAPSDGREHPPTSSSR